MITIIEILLAMFLFSKHYIAATIWVLSIFFFQSLYEKGYRDIYSQIIDSYPVEDYIVPKRFNFLYKQINIRYGHFIPKEMYYFDLIKIYGFVIYTLLLIIFLFIDEYTASIIGVIYIIFHIMMTTLSVFLMKYKCSNKRYISSPDRIIGKCKIVAKTKQFNKTYVTVIMEETGEVKEKVLLQRKILEDNAIYDLYEIEKEYYII